MFTLSQRTDTAPIQEQSLINARSRKLMALREMQRRHLIEIECQWMEELHLISPAYAQRDLTGRIMAMAVLIAQIHEASRELSLPGKLRRGVSAGQAQ